MLGTIQTETLEENRLLPGLNFPPCYDDVNEIQPVVRQAVATRILIVEDNPADVRMIRYALEEEKDWSTETIVANDGEKAIDFLLRKGAFKTAPIPDLVILDLNLPKRDGTEVLHAIRTHEQTMKLPVIVLSSSPEDVILNTIRAAHLEATSYLTKPTDVDEFLALGRVFRRFATV